MRSIKALCILIGLACGHSLVAYEAYVLSESPRIVFLDHFLTESECDALIEKATPHLQRSTIVNKDSLGNVVDEGRTSRGMFISPSMRDDLVKNIEERVAALTNMPIENGEYMQVVNYACGEEYKPHFDFFDKDIPGEAVHIERWGQRVVTVIMYLHTTEQGGETIFPEAGFKIFPYKGNAVLFYNCLDGEEDYRTLHGGAPVLAGEKWIATKWMRSKRFE